MPPDDEVESLRANALQQSLPFANQVEALAAVQPRRHHRRLAVAEKVLRAIGKLPPHPPLATGPPPPQLSLPL